MENIDTCSLCFETYEEASRPRVLQCGHTYCTDCLAKLIINGNPVCPMCSSRFVASSASQIPINYTLEKCISSVKEKFVSTSKSPPPDNIRTVQDLIDSQKLNVSSLLLSSKAFDVDITEYQKFLETNAQKNKDLANKLHKRAAWHESIAKLMLEEQEKAKEAQSQVALLSTNLKSTVHELDCGSGNAALADAFHKLLDNFGDLSNCISRNQAEFPDHKISSSQEVVLRNLELIGENDKSPAPNKTNSSSSFSDSHMTIMEKLDRPMYQNSEMILTVDEIRSYPDTWKKRIKAGKVFSVSATDTNKRSAALSMKNGKVYLHCLQHQEIPPLSYSVKHQVLVSSAEKDSTTVFLDWALNGSPKGQILIKMISKSPLAKHFMALCTGELGPTYINKKVTYKSTFMGFQSYEKGDMESGSDPLDQINLGDAMYRRAAEKGATLMYRNGSFTVSFNVIGGLCDHMFGKVEDGLDMLVNATGNNPRGSITIIDTGIILEA